MPCFCASRNTDAFNLSVGDKLIRIHGYGNGQLDRPTVETDVAIRTPSIITKLMTRIVQLYMHMTKVEQRSVKAASLRPAGVG